MPISRDDARMLIAERAAAEERRAELLRRADAQAEEFDRRWRAQIGAGIPSSTIPPGSTYLAAVVDAELNSRAEGYRPGRSTVAEDLLSSNGSLTYHPLTGEPAE